MKLCYLTNRLKRIITGKKGIYGRIGRRNHFSEGVIIYENASIGSDNYFSPYAIINNAQIGNYCSIGPAAKIGLAEHDYNAISTKPNINNGNGNMDLFKNKTRIDNDVWIGANVIIRQGIIINNGAVVGANSVVLSDVPPYSVVVGAPARVIKYRFREELYSIINESEWFKLPPEEAKKMVFDIYDRFNSQ